MLGLQLARTAALSQRASCILTHNKYALIARGVKRKNILAVLQSAKAHQDSIAQAKADIERLNAEIAAEKEAAKAERAAAKEAAKAEKEAAKAAEAAAKEAEEQVEEIVEEVVEAE